MKKLGPGLLYAGAAIGVSHLVQSTRAGAQYGYILIIAILLAHFFKYPFFVIGPRYAHLTKRTLIEGYAKIGKWAVVTLLIITLTTMFTIQAAVTIVTAGLVQKMLGVSLSPASLSAVILFVCLVILQVGKFKVLENLMKVIMIVLSVSTIVAFVFSFGAERVIVPESCAVFSFFKTSDLAFLIAFVGWMPAPLDIGVWHSIWLLEFEGSEKKTIKDVNFDFRIGFYGTAVLGIFFLVLGANTIYGTGVTISSSAGGFATQLIDSFTSSLGQWSYWFILIAAFTTMFSTTLTCFDAMPKVVHRIGNELGWKRFNTTGLWRIILGAGALLILFFFVKNMGEMVRFATTISFLTAPLLAYLCYKLYQKEKTITLWSAFEKRLAILGIIVLFAFAFLYVIQIT